MGKSDGTCDHNYVGSNAQCDGGVDFECSFDWCDVACCGDHFAEVMFDCYKCRDVCCYSHGVDDIIPTPERDDNWVTVYICDDCQD